MGNQRATILVIEDDQSILQWLYSILRRADYQVLPACSASEGLRMGVEWCGPIELLLADVSIPAMPGHYLAALIQEHRPGMRVILMSGSYDWRQMLAEGWQFLEKPFQARALLDLVGKEMMERGGAAG